LDASSGKARLPKTRRVPEAFSGRELTERSLKIIETIGRYRFLSSSKIIRLVGGNEDVTHRHLQQLFHRGFISRMKVPSAPVNSEFVYFLENAALLKSVARDTRINAEYLNFDEIRLNREKYGRDGATNGRRRTGQMLFIEHELMISDFHAALEAEASLSEGRVGLDVWQQGNNTWATVPTTRDSAALPHRPDAYFVLKFPNAPDGQQYGHFFYEADRNTTSRTRFKLKLVAYVQFFLQGLYREKYGARKVRDPEWPLPPSASVEPAALSEKLDALYASAAKNDTSLQREQQMVEKNQLATQLAHKEYLPDFGVAYMYQQRPNLPDMNGMTFTINVPVFYKSKQREEVRQATGETISAERSRDNRKNDLQFELKQNYLAAQASKQLLDLYSKAVVPQSSLALESSMPAYEVGNVDFLTVLSNFSTILNQDLFGCGGWI